MIRQSTEVESELVQLKEKCKTEFNLEPKELKSEIEKLEKEVEKEFNELNELLEG